MKDEEIIREAQRRYVPGERSALFVEGAKWALGQEKKVIDLSKVAGQPIPMLFSHSGTNWMTGFLTRISDTNCYERRAVNKSSTFRYCKFDLEAHPVAWFGGECPLPEGVLVTAWFRHGGTWVGTIPCPLDWSHCESRGDIIAFKVTGLQKGYVYPWEV